MYYFCSGWLWQVHVVPHDSIIYCSKLNQRTLHQRNHTNTHHCLLQLATSPTLPQQISSMETVLSTLQQLNLLSSTHYTQWSTMSCTHSSLDYYPVKVKKYMGRCRCLCRRWRVQVLCLSRCLEVGEECLWC
jgi:hypothetical protein